MLSFLTLVTVLIASVLFTNTVNSYTIKKEITDDYITMDNGYVFVAINKITGSIENISADFHGNGNFYGNNILSLPISIEVLTIGNCDITKNTVSSTIANTVTSTDSNNIASTVTNTISHDAATNTYKKVTRSGGKTTRNTEKTDDSTGANVGTNNRRTNTIEKIRFNFAAEDDELVLTINNIQDSCKIATEQWVITMNKYKRSITIETFGTINDNNKSSNDNEKVNTNTNVNTNTISLIAIKHSIYLKSNSLYGLFDRGVVQMMGNINKCLGSDDKLHRVYFIGNNTASDIIITHTDDDNSDRNNQIVLMSNGANHNSGIQDILVGDYPNLSTDVDNSWSNCWMNANEVELEKGFKYSSKVTIIPNNYNFPVYQLEDVRNDPLDLPFIDLQTYLMGGYGSPAGCLQSYYTNQIGIIAPTISHPDVGYDPDTNFFDPDNYISLSALLYLNDPYFNSQVKNVLERTSQTMCGIGNDQNLTYCNGIRERNLPRMFLKDVLIPGDATGKESVSRKGQLMHHFISLSPTYESVAGSEQLGPNLFWTLSVLKYTNLTGDTEWAKEMFSFIDLSTKFVLSFYDASMDMILAPGPLWIDVLVRENYTSDSNAAVVHLFRELSTYYNDIIDDEVFSRFLSGLADRITVSMNQHLWADDHYITQLNLDGTTRDFVDYDSNLLAVAFNIATDAQASKILNRIDSNTVSHVRATWCSETFYSGDAEDCYIVGGSFCGDSIVSLARIGWIDALSRQRMSDYLTFNNVLLEPLQQDLMENIWLYERYDKDGNQIRTPFYFEYPSLIVMMLREMKYHSLEIITSSES